MATLSKKRTTKVADIEHESDLLKIIRCAAEYGVSELTLGDLHIVYGPQKPRVPRQATPTTPQQAAVELREAAAELDNWYNQEPPAIFEGDPED